jgi:hypothetical protein
MNGSAELLTKFGEVPKWRSIIAESTGGGLRMGRTVASRALA